MGKSKAVAAKPNYQGLIDMESGLHAAWAMATIAAELLESNISDKQDHFALTGKEHHYVLHETQTETMLFAVYETHRMIRDLRESYLRAFLQAR